MCLSVRHRAACSAIAWKEKNDIKELPKNDKQIRVQPMSSNDPLHKDVKDGEKELVGDDG